MATLRELLDVDSPDMNAITAHLDALDPAARLAGIRSLKKRHQSTLFEAAAGHRPISVDFLVPRDRPPLEEVVHRGKNSLALFTHFAKVFCRPDGEEADSGALWGYNRTSGFVRTTVGPGYFVAYDHGEPGEVLIDYTRLPPRKPDAWPRILSNSARLSRFVYNGTEDVLRGVSTHVSIGRATKNDKPMNAWFVLCREDPQVLLLTG